MSAVTTNWRFLAPGPVEDVLLLPVHDEQVEGTLPVQRDRQALADRLTGTYAAVVAPDLSGWARDVAGAPCPALLLALCSAVAPGGWLCIGFANRGYPARPFTRGSWSARSARRQLEAAGFEVLDSYLAFPDQTRPAYLVPCATLPHFLRELFVPYVESRSALRGRTRQQLLRLMRTGALAAPDRLRSACAPAAVLFARRPA